MKVFEVIQSVNDVLWSQYTPYVLLFAGVLFTIWTRFTQYHAMTHGIKVVRGKYDHEEDPGAISHFQALSAALSATVGLGNIGGVALAIAAGGPGALFWMWIVGVFGMALKTIEITLAMMYRNTDDPENPHGGAMWVVEKVLGSKGGRWKIIARAIGVFFCITLIISTFTGGNMYQAYSVADLTKYYFDVPKIVTGIVMAVLVGMVIIGGIKRIGDVAGKLVPIMCVIYLLAAFSVLAVYMGEIPGMFALIFESAFNPTEATGAFIGGTLGYTFMQGMKRALFSNEAGQGSAPIAHAAAKTKEPAREGIVGGIGPFIDTLCICTVTALVILATGTWNRAAVGDITESVALNQSEKNVYQIANTKDPKKIKSENEIPSHQNIKSLPEKKSGPWKSGDNLFLMAKTDGPKHSTTDSSLLRVKGSIVEAPTGATDEAKGTLVIAWSQVKIKPDEWSEAPKKVTLVSKSIYADYNGATLTGHAFDRAFPGLGKWLVTLAAWLFAISTMISWSYYGEQGMVYMVGNKGVLPYKIVFLIGAIYAAAFIESTEQMVLFMDLGTGAMLWANIPIVLCLGFLAVRCLGNYRDRLNSGEFDQPDK